MSDHEIYLSKISAKSFNHLENQTSRRYDILTFSVWRNRRNSADENRPRSMFFDRREHRLAWWLYCHVSMINQYDSRRMATPLRSSANSLARAYAATIEARNLMNKKKKDYVERMSAPSIADIRHTIYKSVSRRLRALNQTYSTWREKQVGLCELLAFTFFILRMSCPRRIFLNMFVFNDVSCLLHYWKYTL